MAGGDDGRSGNVSTYYYVSGYELAGHLDRITDAVGRTTQFSYNANGLLSSIRIPAAEDGAYREVFYTYDSSSRLTGVRYSDLGGTNPHTTYSYEGTTRLLTGARNYDGVQVRIGYEPVSLYGNAATDDHGHIRQLRAGQRIISQQDVILLGNLFI